MENRIIQFGKSDGPVFVTSASYLIFFYLDPLMSFSPFSYFKTPWIFKISFFLGFTLKLLKPDNPE
jgi:hypothetical protein